MRGIRIVRFIRDSMVVRDIRGIGDIRGVRAFRVIKDIRVIKHIRQNSGIRGIRVIKINMNIRNSIKYIRYTSGIGYMRDQLLFKMFAIVGVLEI